MVIRVAVRQFIQPVVGGLSFGASSMYRLMIVLVVMAAPLIRHFIYLNYTMKNHLFDAQ
jgi:hypothetical protein